MDQHSSLPSYIELTNIFQKIQANSQTAQIHGMLCGYICATTGGEADFWEEIFPNAKKNRKGHEILKQIYETTYHQLSEFSFEFNLLLPDDQVDINARAEALGLWCQGFLTALEQLHVSIQSRPQDEVKEALDDLIEIAKINFGDIATNEEDEAAYFELVEYVRLTVLMIFHELKTDRSQEGLSEDTLQH